MTGQDTIKHHQDHNKQALHSDPQRNSDNYSEKAEGRQDMKNSIATAPLVSRCIPFRAKYNVKLRKINICVKGIPLIANI